MSKKKDYDQSTKAMMDGFMDLFNDGKSIKEIAEHFSVTDRLVYFRLGEIAEKNGLTREDLLQRVIEKKGERSTTLKNRYTHTIEDINKSCEKLSEVIDEVDKTIKDLLETIDESKKELLYERN